LLQSCHLTGAYSGQDGRHVPPGSAQRSIGCEITGFPITADQRTLFVNIQHPGEAPRAHPGRNDADKPKAFSSWPDGEKGGRPRSATIAIRRKDGGLIGT
jgi:secreted PhoX family phosphatase